MNTRLHTLLRWTALTVALVGASCNESTTNPQANKPAASLPPEAVKLHLAIQGADPAFLQQLDSTVGFTSLDGLVQHLIQLVHTAPDAKQKVQAAVCLGALSPHSIQPLIRALKDNDSDVAMYAAAAFAKMGPSGKQAIPELIGALGHEGWNVRVFAAQALGAMGPDARTDAALKAASSDPNPSVRKAASEALQKLRGTGAP